MTLLSTHGVLSTCDLSGTVTVVEDDDEAGVGSVSAECQHGWDAGDGAPSSSCPNGANHSNSKRNLWIKAMKEMYLPELNELYQKVAVKFELQPQEPIQIDGVKFFKHLMQRTINFLLLSKDNVVPAYKDKLPADEMQILSILNSKRPTKPVFSHSQQQQQQQLRSQQ